MLTTRERWPPTLSLRGGVISVPEAAGAIRECEEHGWMQDRADPHARQRAFDIVRDDLPPGVSPQIAAAALSEMPESIGDAHPNARMTESDVGAPR
jgi:hypothetical protein